MRLSGETWSGWKMLPDEDRIRFLAAARARLRIIDQLADALIERECYTPEAHVLLALARWG